MLVVVRRILMVIPSVIVVTAVLFIGTMGLLGSPASQMLGADASLAAIEELNRRYGFDRPILVQYVEWLGKAVTGDFGRAFVSGQSVSGAIAETLPITIELALLATLLAASAAIILNSIPVMRRAITTVLSFVNVLGVTTPNFMIAIAFIYLFSVELGWFPTAGWAYWSEDPSEHVSRLVLPVLTMSAYYFSLFSIVYRSEYTDTSRRLYIQVARAKGISRWRLSYRHILPNAILPVITFIGVSMGQMMGGAVVVETVFSIPGLGRLFVSSILQHDFPVMLAIGALLVTSVVVMNLIADIAYTILNPQIRLS